MKSKICLPLAAAATVLAACKYNDPRPVRIDVSGNRFNIPEGCFDAPAVIGGRDQRVPQRDLLLAVLLPKLTCRDQSNYKRFLEVRGDSGPETDILVSGYGPRANRERAADAMFEFMTTGRRYPGNKDFKDQHRKLVSSGPQDEHYTFVDNYNMQTHDAYRNVGHRNSYIVCSRSQKPGGGEPFVGTCEQYFAYRNLSIKLRYGASWQPRWHQIELDVRTLFDSFLQLRPDTSS